MGFYPARIGEWITHRLSRFPDVRLYQLGPSCTIIALNACITHNGGKDHIGKRRIFVALLYGWITWKLKGDLYRWQS